MESEDESHDQQCRVCKERGEMILCDFCPGVYHLDCLNPPLTTVPEGDWKCPQCEVGEARYDGGCLLGKCVEYLQSILSLRLSKSYHSCLLRPVQFNTITTPKGRIQPCCV